ncbi:MAG: hypothetical protein NC112_05815 [Oxalobacter formigenes]|nr:hypothetical protein [Oxalobacter formigenes]
MASTKEFYLKAIVTAQDRLTPALKNIAKQAESARNALKGAGGAINGFNDRLYSGGKFQLLEMMSGAAKSSKLFRAELAKVGSRSIALGKQVGILTAGFFGAVGGIHNVVSGAAAAGDALQKMSIRTGMSAESIQEWRFAADRSGISAETFDTAIAKMTVNMGQLRSGTGAFAKTVAGISPVLAKQLKNPALTAEQAFEKMLDAIRQVPDAQRRALLAQQFFGKAGAGLVTLANEDADALKGLRARARELGIISNEQAENSAKFVDAMTDLKKRWGDLRMTFAMKFLPSLTPFINKMTAFLIENKEQINKAIDSIVKPLSAWVDSLDPAEIVQGMLSLIDAVKGVIDFFGGLKNTVLAYVIVTNIGLIPALIRAALAFKGLLVAMGPIALAAAALVAGVWLIYQNWDTVASRLKDVWNDFSDFIRRLWDSVKKIFSDAVDWIMNLMETFNPFAAIEGGDGMMLAGAGVPSLPARMASAQASQLAAAGNPVEIQNNIVIEAPEGSRIKEVSAKSKGADVKTSVGHRSEGSLA